MSGGFEMESIPVFREGIPKGFEYQLLPENWDHFGGCILAKIIYLVVWSSLILVEEAPVTLRGARNCSNHEERNLKSK